MDHALRRRLRSMEHLSATTARLDGRAVVLFCSNDYLGLAWDPRVIEAAAAAGRKHGAGSGASRLISGSLSLHAALEERLAAYKGTETALLYGSGYLANLGVIPALTRKGDILLSDRLNHASLWDGCRLSPGTLRVYEHADPRRLERHLERSGRTGRAIIVTDGVFSMDGDLAPLSELAKIASRHDGFLIVDDAHGTGVVGPEGRGTFDHCGLSPSGHVEIGTLSKALGSYGAFVAGSNETIESLVQGSRTLIYSTALPPPAVGAALESLSLLIREPDRRERLWKNHEVLVSGLLQMGIRLQRSVSPIVPVIVGPADRALEISRLLLDRGIYAPAIRPPTVPEGTSRIRLTVSSEHTHAQIERLIDAFAAIVRIHPQNSALESGA